MSKYLWGEKSVWEVAPELIKSARKTRISGREREGRAFQTKEETCTKGKQTSTWKGQVLVSTVHHVERAKWEREVEQSS